MPWQIHWTEQALRDLDRLDAAIARRVILAVERGAADAPASFRRLKGRDDCRMRVGDWRVVAVLAHKAKTVVVKGVGHRPTVYR